MCCTCVKGFILVGLGCSAFLISFLLCMMCVRYRIAVCEIVSIRLWSFLVGLFSF